MRRAWRPGVLVLRPAARPFILERAMHAYPHVPCHKISGTSEETAASVEYVAPDLRERVYTLLFVNRVGLTADECAAATGATVLSIRPRLSELRRKNLIVSSGKRRKNALGRSVTVWTLANPIAA
jgi:hypothetical protein